MLSVLLLLQKYMTMLAKYRPVLCCWGGLTQNCLIPNFTQGLTFTITISVLH